MSGSLEFEPLPVNVPKPDQHDLQAVISGVAGMAEGNDALATFASADFVAVM